MSIKINKFLKLTGLVSFMAAVLFTCKAKKISEDASSDLESGKSKSLGDIYTIKFGLNEIYSGNVPENAPAQKSYGALVQDIGLLGTFVNYVYIENDRYKAQAVRDNSGVTYVLEFQGLLTHFRYVKSDERVYMDQQQADSSFKRVKSFMVLEASSTPLQRSDSTKPQVYYLCPKQEIGSCSRGGAGYACLDKCAKLSNPATTLKEDQFYCDINRTALRQCIKNKGGEACISNYCSRNPVMVILGGE